MKYYPEDYEEEEQQVTKEKWVAHEQNFGCKFCYDSRMKKEIELYFFDKANNMRLCEYCPYCGRKYGEVYE